jgi:hypothetical protein
VAWATAANPAAGSTLGDPATYRETARRAPPRRPSGSSGQAGMLNRGEGGLDGGDAVAAVGEVAVLAGGEGQALDHLPPQVGEVDHGIDHQL